MGNPYLFTGGLPQPMGVSVAAPRHLTWKRQAPARRWTLSPTRRGAGSGREICRHARCAFIRIRSGRVAAMAPAAGQPIATSDTARTSPEDSDSGGRPVQAEPTASDPARVLSLLAGIDGVISELLQDVGTLTSDWKDAMHAQADSSVDHILLYDSAAADLEKNVKAAVDSSNALQRSTLDLAALLSGMDMLAQQVQSVKRDLDELESSTKVLLQR